MKKLTAPRVAHYIEILSRVGYRGFDYSYSYDDKTYEFLDELFELLKTVKPVSKNGARELWFCADRGTIEDFGDFDELLEEGEVNSREEFEEWWLSEYPTEKVWYHFGAVEDEDIGYRMITLRNKFVIEVDSRKEKNCPNDISEFAGWLLEQLKECISKIKDGTYNFLVEKELPVKHRTGTITRKDMWDIFPESRESFFENISKADVDEFIRLASEQSGDMGKFEGRLKTITANDFYSFCALGYKENAYNGCDRMPKEQYYLHADGRDDGLAEIDADSPDAFREWYHDRNRHGGHPWEVCRGGNSTHVSLYVIDDKNEYYLMLDGDAWNRTIETVKFYLALRRAGLPVFLQEAKTLVARMNETEKIGIVPDGVIPAYCESHFPNEHIIDFMNLPDENQEEFARHCVWQPLVPARFIEK